MKRAAVVVLTLVAALAGPLRQACGTECADMTTPAAEAASAEAACHKPVPAPEGPDGEHCTHDHSTSLRPAHRLALEYASSQPAVIPAPPLQAPLLAASSAPRPVNGLSPGSPPVLIVPLRI